MIRFEEDKRHILIVAISTNRLFVEYIFKMISDLLFDWVSRNVFIQSSTVTYTDMATKTTEILRLKPLRIEM